MSYKIKLLLVIAGFLLLTILHFDFWWFNQVNPIILGFLPISIWFQVLVGGILASVFLYYAYKVIWPEVDPEFEDSEE
ncbi:hypothetical protein [Oceanobacillus sp. CF4.6]|uniref:hypothetical protein n=1 Tax=Oceanobacillus sp. CF4.6 TaxID=3373080 RepID=UPI003EE640CF